MSKVILNQKKRLSLQQATVIVFLGIAAVILLALLSYSPVDPGPFHHDSQLVQCANLAGCKGAWLANFLIGLLGYLAYALPVVLVALGLTTFRINPLAQQNPNNPVGGSNDILTSIGALLTLLSGAGLAHLLCEPYPSGIGGGLLGQVVGEFCMRTLLGFVGSVLLLLSLFLGSITLVGDISWGKVTEKVGDWMLQLFEKLQVVQGQNSTNTSGNAPAQTAAATPRSANEARNANVLGRISGGVTGALQDSKGSLGDSFGKAADWMSRTTGLGKNAHPLQEGVDVIDLKPNTRQDPILDIPDFPASRSTAGSSVAKAPNLTSVGTNVGLVVNKPLAASSSVVSDDLVDLITGAGAVIMPTAADKIDTNSAANKVKTIKPAKGRVGNGQRSTLILPPLKLLNPPPKERVTQSKERLHDLARKLVEALGHYGIKDGVKVVAIDPGPVITRFELQLPDGTKASKVSGLASDLARNMCVSSVRVVEVIPGRPTIGVEVPNDKRDVVTISEMLNAPVYTKNLSPLTLALGKDIAGNPLVADLARMPHLLVAGTTGSGKSVFVNAVLMSLLYKATPEEVRMIMIDPKMLELSSYEDIPHLLAPVVTDMKHAANALRWCVAEMERRYLLMSKLKVRNIAGFNEKVREAKERGDPLKDPLFDPLKSVDAVQEELKPLPYIVVIVDEFADMMMVVGKKVEELIARLAQKARASGIHLILATQRPSVDVITGLIKANIPTRIAFQVSTKIDSRTILDQSGAEQLLGFGDMLYMPPGTSLPLRIHGALVTDREVEDVANYLKLQGEPDYILDVLADTTSSDSIPGLETLAERDGEADPLYDEAVAVVIESRRASISYLQRRLKVGYNRAARMIEDMETAGVVSPVLSNGSRDVLVAAPPKD